MQLPAASAAVVITWAHAIGVALAPLPPSPLPTGGGGGAGAVCPSQDGAHCEQMPFEHAFWHDAANPSAHVVCEGVHVIPAHWSVVCAGGVVVVAFVAFSCARAKPVEKASREIITIR